MTPPYISIEGFYFFPIFLAVWNCASSIVWIVIGASISTNFYVVFLGMPSTVAIWEPMLGYSSTAILFLGFVALVHFLKLLVRRLRLESRIDTLTGLKNRRGLLERAEYEVARAARYGRQITFALVDLDDFKTTTDGYT